MFLEAVRNTVKQDSTWQTYLDTEELYDDGRITCKAVPHGSPSTDADALLKYCRQISDQGFAVEIAVDEMANLHVVTWEVRQPTWPVELCPVLSIRWYQISELPSLPQR